MKILAIGDSFTYGEELPDLELAWPCVLAKQLNSTVTNLGQPASGNTRMVRTAIEHSINYDLVIIAWSRYTRIETSDELGTYDLWPGCSSLPHRKSMPYREELIRYITLHHNDEYLYKQYLVNIVLLQAFFKNNGIKYLMLDSFGNNNGTVHFRNNCPELVRQIDSSYYLGWPTESMMEWTYGSPKGPGGDFLEEGHLKVANKLYEYIRHLNRIS